MVVSVFLRKDCNTSTSKEITQKFVGASNYVPKNAGKELLNAHISPFQSIDFHLLPLVVAELGVISL